MARALHLRDLFNIHPDCAAAGQPDLPGGFVGYAKFQHLRLAAVDDIDGFADHGAFDACADLFINLNGVPR